MRLRYLSALVASTGLIACLPPAGDPLTDLNKDGIVDSQAGTVRGVDTVTLAAPASPSRTVFFSVRSAADGSAITDQAVQIVTAKDVIVQEVTDANGSVLFNGVAPNQFGLRVVREGFVSAIATFNPGSTDAIIDNYTVDLGIIYLLPVDSNVSFTLVTNTAQLVANQQVYVESPTMLWDNRVEGNISYYYGVRPYGITTTVLTTDAQGFASMPSFNANKLFATNGYISAGNQTGIEPTLSGGQDYTAFDLYRIITPSYDVNADGIMDFAGSVQEWTVSDVQAQNNKLVCNPIQAIQSGAGNAFGIVATNLLSTNDTTQIAQQFGANSPIRVVYNQPVDLASVLFAVSNEFPNNNTANGTGSPFNNSTPVQTGQAFPVPPVAAGLTPTLDASGTVLTLTPATGWLPGAQYLVAGQASSARANNSFGQTATLTSSGYAGFVTEQSAPLAVANVFLDRVQNGEGYDNIIFTLNQLVRGYRDGTGLNGAFLLVCVDDDINGDGDRINGGTGFLDPAECGPTGYNYRTEDIGVALIKARQVANLNQANIVRGAARFWEVTPGQLQSVNKTSAKLKVVFPVVDGMPYISTDNFGTTSNLQGAQLMNQSVVASPTVLDASFSLTGTSTTPVIFEMSSADLSFK